MINRKAVHLRLTVYRLGFTFGVMGFFSVVSQWFGRFRAGWHKQQIILIDHDYTITNVVYITLDIGINRLVIATTVCFY